MTLLGRRVLAEGLGTAFLVMAVVGSGIAASRLSPHDVGLQLLENSLVTGAVLVALILALQPVSAAFNPVVTLVERVLGMLTTRTAVALVVAQIAGGLVGVVVANLMFDLAPVSIATTSRSGGGLWLGEAVATFGLVLVIFGSLRAGRTDTVAFAVGGYITAAYWFTSSTSFANPAVTIARMFSDTFAGIDPASAPMFIAMQVLGGALGLALRPRHAPLPVGGPGMNKPTVLFVCVHNAGRSQMAAGYLQHLAGDRIQVCRRGPSPPTRSTRSRSRPCGRRASTSPANAPRCSPPTPYGGPTSWSRWAAATRARTSRASGTRTGRWTTPPVSRSRPSARSATRSSGAWRLSSRTSRRPPERLPRSYTPLRWRP